MIDKELFLDKKRFSMMIEERVKHGGGYIDNVVAICEEMDIDYNEISPLITSILKTKIEAEAIEMNYMKGGNTLPI